MAEFLQGFHPMVQALFATLFTWFMTLLGAGVAFFGKEVSRKMLDWMLGFAGGVMIAASYWSLLAPSIEMSELLGYSMPWVPAAVGFLLGGVVLRGIDMILPHLHAGLAVEQAEGPHTAWRKTTLLVLAITLHNIPEGLAVGVAFGAAAAGLPSATLAAAISLAVGIGIQNFPEGLAVAAPLRRAGYSRFKSFWVGQASGLVEPAAGLIGAAAVLAAQSILPYALAFAAGAMIFVVVEELIPESQQSGNGDLATMGVMIGFAVMMILDVALG
jgi:zinc transporter, ZIP family